jgi:LuxR family maltose regulon positive regulatory protein
MGIAYNDPILSTKLYIPRARPDRVDRPRLIAHLIEAMQRPVTLVCSPAGYGKTTLLSEWIPQYEH